MGDTDSGNVRRMAWVVPVLVVAVGAALYLSLAAKIKLLAGEVGGEPPYISRIRLLNNCEEAIAELKIEVLKQEAPPMEPPPEEQWDDITSTLIGEGESSPLPIEPGMGYAPAGNDKPGFVYGVRVTVKLEGEESPHVCTHYRLAGNAGYKDLEVYVVVEEMTWTTELAVEVTDNVPRMWLLYNHSASSARKGPVAYDDATIAD